MHETPDQLRRFNTAALRTLGALERTLQISQLMALAIHCDQMIRDSEAADLTELSRLPHASQPRLTQIMNLLHLPPDIQETLLFLPRTVSGRDQIHEKLLRPIVAEMNWERQRGMWGGLWPFGDAV